MVNLTVERVRSGPGEELLAIIFEEIREPLPPAAAPAVTAEDEPLVAQLEAEVKALRNELLANAEEYDLANEELKAANEEVTSTNEELQSANEELEASKEEMQSVNEELSTVNSQLGEKVGELTAANNDLANLVSATEIATIFLDGQLRVKRFTPKATELLDLIASDVGRPVSHIFQNIGDQLITTSAESTLKTLATIEKDVRTRSGRWFTMRVLPYRTLDDRIDGVVVTFSDVSRLKEAQERLAYEKTYAESIVETVRDPLIVLDWRLHVLSANAAFYQVFRIEPRDTIGQLVYNLNDRHWDIPRLRELFEEISRKKAQFQDFEVEEDFPEIGRKTFLLNARWIEPAGDVPARILLAIEDVTDRRKEQKELQSFSAHLEQLVTDRTALAEQRAVKLRALASELAQSEQHERERLARMLHDDIQQLLAGAKFQLSVLKPGLREEPSQKAFAVMNELLDQSLEATRSLTRELSPAVLFEEGLEAALSWLARQMEVNHGLVVQTAMNAHVEHDQGGVAMLLYQAARELLFNVVKHAKVKEARIQLSRIDRGKVQVNVSDEGVGFDPEGLRFAGMSGTGLGLFGIRERLEHLGGQFELDTAPGRGTRVTLTAAVGRPRKRT